MMRKTECCLFCCSLHFSPTNRHTVQRYMFISHDGLSDTSCCFFAFNIMQQASCLRWTKSLQINKQCSVDWCSGWTLDRNTRVMASS